MSKIVTPIVATAFALLLGATPMRAETLIAVVIDNSGVLHDEQDPSGKTGFTRYMGKFLTDLARTHRRDRDSTRVILISAVKPAHIIWAGDAASFYREGIKSIGVEAILSGSPFGCNSLSEALAEAGVNVRLSSADQAELYVVTSGVSAPDCETLSQEDYAKLVANPDQALAEPLKVAANQFNQVTVAFLTAPHRRALLDAIDLQNTSITLLAQGQ